MAVGVSIRFGTRAEAQAANLQSWGFNAVETNPLAYGRFRAFQEAYPEIIVELSPDSDTQRILTAAVSETLPDLLWLGRGVLNSYIARGSVLRPLSDLIERDSYDLSRFYPAAIEESTYDDQIWGIPGGMDVGALFVNVDALAEVGVSDVTTLSSTEYQQLIDLGAQLTTREGDVVTRWGFDPKTQDGQFYEWAQAAGAQILGGDDGLQPQFNSAGVVGVVEQAIPAYEAQGGYQTYEAVRSSWQNDEQFARGQVAMTVYQNWMAGIIASTVPERNFRVLPLHPNSDPSAISAVSGGNAWCISENSQNVDAAWEFIKFMHSDETWMTGAQTVKAAREAAGQPYLPSLTGVPAVDQRQIDELYVPIAPQWDEAVQLFPQILAASSKRPLSPSPYAQQLDQILIQTGVLPALRGERPVQEAMDAAQAEAESAVSGF
jgi:multiple sugar transport system substrate-binding protein